MDGPHLSHVCPATPNKQHDGEYQVPLLLLFLDLCSMQEKLFILLGYVCRSQVGEKDGAQSGSPGLRH